MLELGLEDLDSVTHLGIIEFLELEQLIVSSRRPALHGREAWEHHEIMRSR